MKKLLFLLLVFFAAFSYQANAQIHLGVGSHAAFNPINIGIQGKVIYEANDSWDVSGAFTYYLRNDRNWAFDANVHYKLLDVDTDFNFAPLAGLNYTSYPDINDEGDLGINLGAIFFLRLQSGKTVYIEPKYIFSDRSFLTISAGYFF